VEHCLAFEETDLEVRREFNIPEGTCLGYTIDKRTKYISTKTDGLPSAARNWNAAAGISTGEILFVIADDVVPDDNWDNVIRSLIGPGQLQDSLVFSITDDRCSNFNSHDIRDILLPRHPLMTRIFYEDRGYIFDERIHGYGMDDALLIEAIRDGSLRDGRSLRLHHSRGKLFDNNGKIICSCYNKVESKLVTPSKSRMEKHKSLERYRVYREVGFWWRFVGALMSTSLLCDYVYSSYLNVANREIKVTPLGICFSLLTFSELKLSEKLKYLARLSIAFLDFTRRELVRGLLLSLKR